MKRSWRGTRHLAPRGVPCGCAHVSARAYGRIAHSHSTAIATRRGTRPCAPGGRQGRPQRRSTIDLELKHSLGMNT
jgi:hypothetical protein